MHHRFLYSCKCLQELQAQPGRKKIVVITEDLKAGE
jgi:hypothetical protein